MTLPAAGKVREGIVGRNNQVETSRKREAAHVGHYQESGLASQPAPGPLQHLDREIERDHGCFVRQHGRDAARSRPKFQYPSGLPLDAQGAPEFEIRPLAVLVIIKGQDLVIVRPNCLERMIPHPATLLY